MEKSRAFYKFPFCHDRRRCTDDVKYEQVEDFYKMLKEIDAYCGSDELKEKIFGAKNIGKHEYQAIVREVGGRRRGG